MALQLAAADSVELALSGFQCRWINKQIVEVALIATLDVGDAGDFRRVLWMPGRRATEFRQTGNAAAKKIVNVGAALGPILQ